ncbi:hypothetical protein KGV55_02635 [Candidatus Gracilibacteria bacterium]|nr:hypothetical protein [Candidatus Gracilibacteria bacterium]
MFGKTDLPTVPGKEKLEQIVQSRYAKAKEFDYSEVVAYLKFRSGLKDKEIAEMCEEYARFIALSTTYKEFQNLNLPISDTLDPIWHAHVLNSESYARFSQEVCGYFIHHYPALSAAGESALTKDYQENTRQLYLQHFGSPLGKYWGETTVAECGCYGYPVLEAA